METEKFEPLGERLLVRIIDKEKKTASGLFVPDNTRGKVARGEVIAVSSTLTSPKVGDIVTFDNFAGNSSKVVEEAGNEQRIISFNELLAIVR